MFSQFYDKPPTLDITGWKQRGVSLRKAIIETVKDTQSVIVRSYPDKIIMTQAQYKMLSGTPDVIPGSHDPSFEQEFYLYHTPHNLMEIIIKDA